MWKSTRILMLATAGLFLLGCETLSTSSLLGKVEKPKIESVSPRITGIDFQGVDLAFDVAVRNPYTVPIKTPKFKYGLDVQDANFLNSEATAKLDLPAKGVGTVVLPVRLGYLDLWRSFQGLKDKSEIPYTLHGALVFSPLGETIELPIKKSGKFPVLRPPRFTETALEPPEVSLSGAKIKATAKMGNPNAFAVGLEQLGYKLQVGDIQIGGLNAQVLNSIKAGESAPISFTGSISGFQAIEQLLSGQKAGAIRIQPTGSIKTPYGAVRLPE